MFAFLRALRLAWLPSLLGALSFAFAGAMSAQVAHFGLVAGMSWVPVQLLCCPPAFPAAQRMPSRLAWTGVLAGTFGLTILAGEPRAIDDAGLIVLLYAAWQIARLGRRFGPAAVSVAAGLALGVCLGAVQWLPGLAVDRLRPSGASSSVALFNSGSLPHRWLLLMLVPDLLGGSGSFGQPAFLAHYNLAEVTGYVGILPARRGRSPCSAGSGCGHGPPSGSCGTSWRWPGSCSRSGATPRPGACSSTCRCSASQRLQSRNILIADLALAVLLAYWADQPFRAGSRRFLRLRGRRGPDLETVLALLPPLAVLAVVTLGLCWGAGLLRWLRVSPGATSLDGLLKPWLVPYVLIAVGAIAFVVAGRRLRPAARSRWLAGFVLADLVVFTLLAVVAVLPGLGSSDSGTGATAGAAARAAVTRTAAQTPRPRPPGEAHRGPGVSRAFRDLRPGPARRSRICPCSARPTSTSSPARRRSRGTPRSSRASTPRPPGPIGRPATGRTYSIPGPSAPGSSTSSTRRSCLRCPPT